MRRRRVARPRGKNFFAAGDGDTTGARGCFDRKNDRFSGQRILPLG
ncbi:MAG TPA: hypothetical protein VFX97_06905 [Pyrinomonadaceae bacterium]|nr:hypothetical protein [Pyrinomonadaceae bacterium]